MSEATVTLTCESCGVAFEHPKKRRGNAPPKRCLACDPNRNRRMRRLDKGISNTGTAWEGSELERLAIGLALHDGDVAAAAAHTGLSPEYATQEAAERARAAFPGLCELTTNAIADLGREVLEVLLSRYAAEAHLLEGPSRDSCAKAAAPRPLRWRPTSWGGCALARTRPLYSTATPPRHEGRRKDDPRRFVAESAANPRPSTDDEAQQLGRRDLRCDEGAARDRGVTQAQLPRDRHSIRRA